MCSAHQFQAIDMIELCSDFATEQPAGASRADRPRVNLLWVAPHQVAEGALMWDLTDPLDGPYLCMLTNCHARSMTGCTASRPIVIVG